MGTPKYTAICKVCTRYAGTVATGQSNVDRAYLGAASQGCHVEQGIQTKYSPWVKSNLNLHEIKVVQPKVDRTNNKTPSLPVVGIISEDLEGRCRYPNPSFALPAARKSGRDSRAFPNTRIPAYSPVYVVLTLQAHQKIFQAQGPVTSDTGWGPQHELPKR